MTLTLNLPREIEIRLREAAAEHGVNAQTYAHRLLDAALRGRDDLARASAEEWEQDLRRFLDGLPRPAAPLPHHAAQRASFYGDSL